MKKKPMSLCGLAQRQARSRLSLNACPVSERLVTLRACALHPHLCVAPAADGASPVRNVDAVWVPDQPVVVLGEVGPRVLGHGAIHVMEHRRLVPVHIQLVEPRPRLSEEHSGSNLNTAQECEAGPEGEGKQQLSSGQGEVSDFQTLQTSQTKDALGQHRKAHG